MTPENKARKYSQRAKRNLSPRSQVGIENGSRRGIINKYY